MVIVFAKPGDGLAADIGDLLAERGRECLTLSPPAPSSPLRLSWQLPAPAPSHVEIDGRRIELEALRGVAVRALPEPPRDPDPAGDAHYLQAEWNAALLGWLQAVPAVVNRPRPGRFFRFPVLYAHAGAFYSAGLLLPRLLVTDSPAKARHLLDSSPHSVHLVPHCFGRPVPLAAADDLPSGACTLVVVPNGERLRIHVVGEDAHLVRRGDGGEDQPVRDLPATLARRSCLLARLLGVTFLELDVVSGAEGEVVVGVGDLPEADFGCETQRRQVARSLCALWAGPRPGGRS